MIPVQHFPKFFFAELRRELVDGRWQDRPDLSGPSLEEQVNTWLEESGCRLSSIASPTVSVYQESTTLRNFVFSVTLLYVLPVLGEQDVQRMESMATESEPDNGGAARSPGGEG